MIAPNATPGPVVGRDLPHDSAHGHVTGGSVYLDDEPIAPGEVFVVTVGSPVAHGRLTGIDLDAALALPDVVGAYTHRDLAHNRLGPIVTDEPLLAEDELMYVGQPVVVLAVRRESAIRAAKAAVVLHVEPLDPVLTITEACNRGTFIGEPRKIEHGDLAAGFAAADEIIEGTFRCGGQDHFYLESQAARVVPGERTAAGTRTLTVHSSTQHPTEVQRDVAHLLGIGQHEVSCVTTRMGGGFGGKESQATHPAVFAALVALRTGRIARLALSKDDDMHLTGKRHPFENQYRIGVTRDGRITAVEATLISDGGAYADLSPAVLARAMTHLDNAYFLPAAHITGLVARTNLPPNTAFRGFGGPQGAATMECAMEEIAQRLGLDPLDVRRRNLYDPADPARNTTPYGQPVGRHALPELFDRLAESAEYAARRAEITRFNAASRTALRGLSLTGVKFGISFNTTFLNQASALVHLYLDGTVQVSTGATEMGQGVNTKMIQLAADGLGQSPDRILELPTSTERSPNARSTAASSAADLNGGAVLDACRILRERLAPVAVEVLGAAADPATLVFAADRVTDPAQPDRVLLFDELVRAAYLRRVDLGARGFFSTPKLSWDAASGTGRPFRYFTTAAACSEVEIDRFTGDLTVLRTDILMDIGRPINPTIDRGQLVGGFVQGLGWLTTEELRYSDHGVLLSHSPTTYKIPGVGDLPAQFSADWLVDPATDSGVTGSKAVGEPPLLTAISVWTAVKDALRAVSGSEPATLRAPATGEEILSRLTHYADRVTLPAPRRPAASVPVFHR